MLDDAKEYTSPLSGRYASRQAKLLTGETFRWANVRSVWAAVLDSQIELGMLENNPDPHAVQTFKDKITEFDWAKIGEIEGIKRHDVMAHISYITDHLVPELGQVLHLGMTSEDATSNGEILQQNAMITHAIGATANFLSTALDQMDRYKSLPMLGETHLQGAAAVTLGKRIAMWIGPIMEDLMELERLLKERRLKGIRGATGTGEAVLKLVNGDRELANRFQTSVADKLGMEATWMVPGQTSPRSWE